MVEQSRAFHVGDQVIHWSHGPGEIVQLDEKEMSGQTSRYYVVQMRNLTLWVPITEEGERCLRFPSQPTDFMQQLEILRSPGELLSMDRMDRKVELTERLREGSLEAICRMVRDLTLFKQTKKANDQDNLMLDRARSLLLTEWCLSLSIPLAQAEADLEQLLSQATAASNPV